MRREAARTIARVEYVIERERLQFVTAGCTCTATDNEYYNRGRRSSSQDVGL